MNFTEIMKRDSSELAKETALHFLLWTSGFVMLMSLILSLSKHEGHILSEANLSPGIISLANMGVTDLFYYHRSLAAIEMEVGEMYYRFLVCVCFF